MSTPHFDTPAAMLADLDALGFPPEPVRREPGSPWPPTRATLTLHDGRVCQFEGDSTEPRVRRFLSHVIGGGVIHERQLKNRIGLTEAPWGEHEPNLFVYVMDEPRTFGRSTPRSTTPITQCECSPGVIVPVGSTCAYCGEVVA